ncbi:MAG TPA: (2Fe-2S)-binding protein [Gammaproteobacteria bacterium]|jgi:anthranilate 1,2-dioxygenase large subunit|uniref:aromatic ring-hydroxylating oxygenase subunit alpha n=1 Tax=Immundisolibacter sp. TaxID=1934948 RepID=UPI000E800CB6|nr:(2Fe-2S)-binding protein [Gammaproteobacteria bacterium]HCZ47460.1 (2Fe-2S)-binding protein [Gammaproteobacteria bacterium]MCH76898.1 (2Fe-2S)-binding protein [Gammaproteobacteria bacterium]
MNAPSGDLPVRSWTDHTHVPYALYTDEAIYRQELERIFYGPFWHPVALEAELEQVNDYKTVVVGETPLIVTRTGADEFAVMINACAHRGVQITTEFKGSAADFTCPYHAWAYDNCGNLRNVPGEDRFPDSFDKRQYGLRRLRAVLWNQVLWATFDDAAPPIEEFFGGVVESIRAALGGGDRKLKLLGYQKIIFNCNWKVFMDNDGYHAGLLHTAFRMLNYQGGKAPLVADGFAGHWGSHYEAHRMVDNGYLADPTLVFTEGDEKTAAVNLLRPVTQVVKHLNAINFRFGRPLGPDRTEVHYTYLGFADDPPELLQHRIRQCANLLGPSGFVSIEDGSMFERVQKAMGAPGGEIAFLKGLKESPDGHLSLQNDEAGNTPWWRYYKQVMGL